MRHEQRRISQFKSDSYPTIDSMIFFFELVASAIAYTEAW